MRDNIRLRDHHRESQIFSSRVIWAALLVAMMSLVLLSRMVWLQWLQYERYASLSDQNRVQTQAMAPPRGLILDRNGTVLADNRPDFSLSVIPEQVPDMTAALDRVAELVTLPENDLKRFQEQLQGRRRPWEPVPLRSRLTERELAVFAAAQHELPGVRITAEAIRYYPQGELLSHVVGYVNRMNQQDLAAMNEDQLANYSGTHFYGRTGIERSYENRLHGQVGYRKVETNARGRILEVIAEQPPVPGDDLVLNLDLAVQQAAWDALGQRRGAVVAIDPRDGGVLAFVSRPGFDSNLFVTGISYDDYSAYREDHDKPLFNRALQGQYPPGSTVKPIIGLAGLAAEQTSWQRTVRDPGWFSLPDTERVYRDWKRGGHAPRVDLHMAVQQSCDVYFYDLGVRMGIDFMHDYLTLYGFGHRTGLDIEGEARGILPSRQWKKANRGASWFHGDTVNASIGQGFFLATPLQLAQSTAILARRGEQMVPSLVADRREQSPLPDPTVADPQDWDLMQQAMIDVVHGLRGTARVVGYGAPYKVAGKTGTSQVFSVPEDEEYNEDEIAERLRDHALFVTYAPADNPAIAVAVMVENGSHGGSTAGPVARAVMDAWLLDDAGDLAVPAPGAPALARRER
ncbi:MAG: penicillin-binding protein 2 [Alcanivoracaceae bacterium]|nr:penicillin-binding protein 2 [Alcanivoracaceae bacterium]